MRRQPSFFLLSTFHLPFAFPSNMSSTFVPRRSARIASKKIAALAAKCEDNVLGKMLDFTMSDVDAVRGVAVMHVMEFVQAHPEIWMNHMGLENTLANKACDFLDYPRQDLDKFMTADHIDRLKAASRNVARAIVRYRFERLLN
jgi:hypothetical protein